MKFSAIDQQRHEYPVDVMCNVLNVSKSGYYAWRQSAAKRQQIAVREQVLHRTMEAIHLGSKKRFGSPPMTDRLKGLGFDVSKRTVARRMKQYGIRSKLKRKFKATTDSNHKLPVAPNHLMQDFRAYRPNQIWMSDITYIPTREGWLYVCAVIDLFSRKIVGWTTSSRMTKDLVVSAYLKARRQQSPGKHLIYHSDRGSQYAAKSFVRLLQHDGVIQSMSRRACCWDSAPIESFWGKLKTECVYWEQFETRQQALTTLRGWIEEEYNDARPHSSLNYATPNEMEENFVLALRVSNE